MYDPPSTETSRFLSKRVEEKCNPTVAPRFPLKPFSTGEHCEAGTTLSTSQMRKLEPRVVKSSGTGQPTG